MSQSDFESPLVPREIADAPDIDNVPVADWMHTLSQTVMEMHDELRRIGERLGGITASGAQNAPQGSASPLPGIPGGPEGATGAPGGTGEVGLGDALREQAARGTSAERRRALSALADRADALQRRAAEAAAAEDRAFEAETAIEHVKSALRTPNWPDQYRARDARKVLGMAEDL
jgi:hypothetical protein